VHRVVLEGLGERFSSAGKLRNDYESFELLCKLGHRAARRFLDAHYDDIGVQSSVDLKAEVYSERE
jgi:NTE family protein